MTRFLASLALGGLAGWITLAATAGTYWPLVVGGTTAALIWFGELILDELTDI